MDPFSDSFSRRVSEAWHHHEPAFRGRSYSCRCGRPVFFRNSACLACGAALGYEPLLGAVRALEPGPRAGTWRLSGGDAGGLYRRCANFDSAAGCNWLVPDDDPLAHCRSCRLNRTIPDLADADNRRYWRATEVAKRRMVSQLLTLGLPLRAKVGEDPERGVAFDLVRSQWGGPRLFTGHDSGLITINIEEADDAGREKLKSDLREPYRTLLGHFRHEIGHYYWDRLVAGTAWHEPFRALFGDERIDYAAALKANYEVGPPPDWADRHISAYASSHPWEDWAETWAHFLHIFDSLDTALGFGLAAENVVSEVDPFGPSDLHAPDDPDAPRFLSLVNTWIEMITALNELARSMGQPDLYPFVMSRPVVRKLQFVYMVIRDARSGAGQQ